MTNIKKAIQAIGAKGVRVTKAAETENENQKNIFVEAWNASYCDLDIILSNLGFVVVHSTYSEARTNDPKTALVRLS